MDTRVRLKVLLIAGAVTCAAGASAQPAPSPSDAPHPPREIIFGPEDIRVDAADPDVELSGSRSPAHFESLVNIRSDFYPELIASAETL